MGFGLELKKILKNRNMSVAEFSRISGISSNTLYAIISRDSSDINSSTLYKINNALETDEIALLDIERNPEKWGISSDSIGIEVNEKNLDEKDLEEREMQRLIEYAKKLSPEKKLELIKSLTDGE